MKRGTLQRSNGAIDDAAAQWVARHDGVLSAADREALERWLGADPRHRTAFRHYQSGWAVLRQPALAGEGGGLENEIKRLSARRRFRRSLVGCALAACVVVGAIAWNQQMTFASRDGSAVVIVPAKQTLPDGSVVELRADATIVPQFESAERRVTLEHGTAYFSVQSDPGRPFTVNAAGVEVRALGTEFAVQITPGRVDVVVSEGTVLVGGKVRHSASAGPAVETAPTSARVGAGNRATVDLSRHTVPDVTTLDGRMLEEILAWRGPRVDFTRTRLTEAVQLLNAHAPPGARRLAVGDERAAAMRVTGVFRPENADAFVLLLEAAFGIRAQASGDRIVLHAAD